MAGLVLLFINIAYTAISIPLGLFYLGKEQFGVWALAQQIAGYFLLLDFGMTAAVSRLIANRKSSVNGGEYGSLLLTGGWVLGVQAVSIFFLGAGFSFFAPFLFGVPPSLAGVFQECLLLLAVVSALSLASRAIGIPLWAFQRMDVINSCMTMNLVFSLATLWIGLHVGWGINSLAVAGLPGVFWTAGSSFFVCRTQAFYPSKNRWGRPSWKIFFQCFGFAKDVFLIGIGSQLVNASQVMVVSKVLGLEAAAVFSVGTKVYTLAYQICTKVIQNSIAGLTDLYVQGLKENFRKRVFDLFGVVGSLAASASCFLILFNTEFVKYWTDHRIVFSLSGDVLLGFLLVPVVCSVAGIETFISMGFLHAVRYLRLVEGLLVVTGCFWAAHGFGLVGILSVLFFISLMGFAFCVLQIRRYLSDFVSFIGIFMAKSFSLLALVSVFKVLLECSSLPFFLKLFLSLLGCFLSCAGIIRFFFGPALRQEIFSFCKRFFTGRAPLL